MNDKEIIKYFQIRIGEWSGEAPDEMEKLAEKVRSYLLAYEVDVIDVIDAIAGFVYLHLQHYPDILERLLLTRK